MAGRPTATTVTPPPQLTMPIQEAQTIAKQAQTILNLYTSRDEIWCDDSTLLRNLHVDRWSIALPVFIKQFTTELGDLSQFITAMMAYFAMKHHEYHYGGYELQLFGQVLSQMKDSANLFINMDDMMRRWRERGYNLPGSDFVTSKWWETYRYCVTKPRITFLARENQRTYLRYRSLKTEIVKDFSNIGV